MQAASERRTGGNKPGPREIRDERQGYRGQSGTLCLQREASGIVRTGRRELVITDPAGLRRSAGAGAPAA